MGGAHDHGNSTASAEFNIWLDPEAARIVVSCGRPIRMVPLDATHRALVSATTVPRCGCSGRPPARPPPAAPSQKRIEGDDATQPMHRAGAAPVHDALAVCAVIDPSVLTTQFIPVDVENGGVLSVGRRVRDFRFRSGKPANVSFAMDADEPKFGPDAEGDPGHGLTFVIVVPCDEPGRLSPRPFSCSRRRPLTPLLPTQPCGMP